MLEAIEKHNSQVVGIDSVAHRTPSQRFVASLARLFPRVVFAIALPMTASHAQQMPASGDSVKEIRPFPFAPGERLEYRISFGPLHVGHGSMELDAVDTVRGVPTYHAVFHVAGGTLFFRVDDRLESWFDTTTLTSLRFTQSIHEGRYHSQRAFEIFPAEGRYERAGDTSYATVPAPLDDISFLFFLRTLSLTVGSAYSFDRYFQAEGNPIGLHVLRQERITVPAGSFDAIVVQPLIKTRGIFSQKGRAEVWLRADGGHEVLQMKAHVVFGSISLVLTKEEMKQ
jgi:hypothetical protein